MAMDIHHYPWNILEVTSIPENEREVKRAYSQKLKRIDRTNVGVFQELQQAYKLALALVNEEDSEENISLREAAESQIIEPEIKDNSSLSIGPKRQDDMQNHESLKERLASQEFDIYEEDDDEDEEIDIQQNLWLQKQEEIALLCEQLSEPKNLRYLKWKELLSSPLMEDIEARPLIKEHIIDILAESVDIDGQEQVYFRHYMDPQLIAYLHEKFDFSVTHMGESRNEEQMVFMALHKYNYLGSSKGRVQSFLPPSKQDKIAKVLAYLFMLPLAVFVLFVGGPGGLLGVMALFAAVFAAVFYVQPLFAKKENRKKAIFIFSFLGLIILKLSLAGDSSRTYVLFPLYCGFILLAFLYHRQESLYAQRSIIVNGIWSLFHTLHIALIIRVGWAVIYASLMGAALPNIRLVFYILLAAIAYGFWLFKYGDRAKARLD